ncbi:DUF2490 domain-containing protein [Candidatus Omnitrophota bacterium]
MKGIIAVGLGVLLCLFAVSPGFALENGDLQIWNTESVEGKISENWKVKAEEELRFGDDVSTLYYHHTDGGFSYKLADWFSLGANYRQVWEKKNKEWETEYRPYLDGTFKLPWQGFEFTDRNRLEYRIRVDEKDAWRYRNKFTAKLPWKWTSLEIRPYVADEIFAQFYDKGINRNRLYAGFTSKISKHLKLDTFYMWQTSRKKATKWVGYNVIGIKVKAVF